MKKPGIGDQESVDESTSQWGINLNIPIKITEYSLLNTCYSLIVLYP
jgi:hypothetical protein